MCKIHCQSSSLLLVAAAQMCDSIAWASSAQLSTCSSLLQTCGARLGRLNSSSFSFTHASSSAANFKTLLLFLLRRRRRTPSNLEDARKARLKELSLSSASVRLSLHWVGQKILSARSRVAKCQWNKSLSQYLNNINNTLNNYWKFWQLGCLAILDRRRKKIFEPLILLDKVGARRRRRLWRRRWGWSAPNFFSRIKNFEKYYVSLTHTVRTLNSRYFSKCGLRK